MIRRQRRAFTITEMLVVMALIIFIMYILAQAFGAGATAFRNLKAIGDMNEKLRTTGQLLRRQLECDHFEDKKRLSDPDFWKEGPPRQGFMRIYHGSSVISSVDNMPPADYGVSGYYREGTDLDGNVSGRAVDHALHFTVKQRGNNRGDFFRAGVPIGSPLLSSLLLPDPRFQDQNVPTFTSPWAEVAVFLRTTGEMTDDPEGTTTPQPLYALHVRQRALVPDNDAVTKANGGVRVGSNLYPSYAEVSCSPDPINANVLYFNNPADVTIPERRLGKGSGGFSGNGAQSIYPTLADEDPAQAGNDVVLTNVLSFEVKVLLDRRQWFAYYNQLLNTGAPMPDFVPVSHPAIQAFAKKNPTYSGVNGPRAFDTWSQAKDDVYDYATPDPSAPQTPLWQFPNSTTSIPLHEFTTPATQTAPAVTHRIRIMAVQITIRIWDVNTRQTRQSSVVVEL